MKLFGVVLLVFVPAIFAQTCPITGIVGDCLGGMCPPAHTCIAGRCCNDTVIDVFPSGSCVDKKDDCPRKRDLCFQTAYITLMSEQCPKTCGKCPGSTAPVQACPDLLTDCASNSKLCSNPLYITMMTTNCPKTCGRCPVGKK